MKESLEHLKERIMKRKDFDWICRHCRYNPTAVPPYVKMKQFHASELKKTKLYRYAKKNKLRADCVFCQAVRQRGLKDGTLIILNDKRFS
jgi:hypothetical protein